MCVVLCEFAESSVSPEHSQLTGINSEANSEADSTDVTEPEPFRDRPRPHSCTVCDKRFKGQHNLNAHQRSHAGLKLYSCSECGKRFTFQGNLIRHSYISAGKYKCVECDKCYGSRCALVEHRRMHSEPKPFECTVCSKQFKNARGLACHRRIVHSENKPYKCHACDRVFVFAGSLKNHFLQVHTDGNLYSCSQCNRRFNRVGNLRKHRCQVEFDAGRYQCNYCGKPCRSKVQLTCHLREHTGAKPYVCEQCSECFAWPGQLRQHRLRSHNEGILHRRAISVRKKNLHVQLQIRGTFTHTPV